MSEVTRILEAVERGEPRAFDRLLPLVYDQLHLLAAQLMAREAPGHTLQPTALVHEAYLRLVDREGTERPANRRYFFAAAAEAMRRILIERARRHRALKRGGDRERRELRDDQLPAPAKPDELLAVDQALDALEQTNSMAAELVKLRYFAGFTIPEAAKILGISPRKANQTWAYARAWLLEELDPDSD